VILNKLINALQIVLYDDVTQFLAVQLNIILHIFIDNVLELLLLSIAKLTNVMIQVIIDIIPWLDFPIFELVPIYMLDILIFSFGQVILLLEWPKGHDGEHNPAVVALPQ
jgi:hypothetical protein